MCGIAGYTHLNRKADPARIRLATESLVHRGPDQQGVFETATVSLGAVRLKIIDLDHGSQPMHAAGVTIVFNGEIYNHSELRRELESAGHAFESRCDTEVVLRAFLEWDVRSFARLRGMFAVALWKEAERRLVLARDRMGIKPLYVHRRGSDVYFGSELKALFVHPEIERRISPEGLDAFLSLNYVPCPFTLIDGIRKLPPGCYLDWQNGREKEERYWTLRFAPDPRITLPDAKAELETLLRASVREHLLSDVPLGIWSSGGVDSSTILHYATEASSSRLKTFSVSFAGRKFDESPYFRTVAERYGSEHHEFDLHPEQSLPEAVQEMAYYSDEPSADAGALPVWFLSKMTRRHVTVALSGDGADELFGGYHTYLADRYARALRLFPAALRKLGAGAVRLLPVSDEKIGLDYKLVRFLNGSLLPPVDAHFFWNGTFTQDEKRRLIAFDPGGELPGFPQGAEAAGPLNRFIWLDQLFYLPDDILYKCDRMSMAHSLEVRPPFLDHRLVEFAARLPESLKIRGSRLKFLLKALMRGKLPDAVLDRRKEGFDIPAHHWLRTTLKPLLTGTLSRRAVEESGLFRWEEIDKHVRNHMERRANLGYHLWGLLVLFLWIRRWNVQPPARPGEQIELFTTESVTN